MQWSFKVLKSLHSHWLVEIFLLKNDFITKNKLEDWTNTWDHERIGDWKGKYDVYSTPTIYFLDDRKIIRGKRLDHTNLGSLVDMLEKKNKKSTKSKS